MKNFKIIGDESDHSVDDFINEDELKSDKDLIIVLDSRVSNDRGDINSPAPLTHITLKSLIYQQQCNELLIGLLFHW